MSVKVSCEYLGDLRVRAIHGPSGTELITDAPVDNQGQGRAFSPTDLAATSVATCILTIMGIHARQMNVDLKGMKVEVEKHMSTNPPRRIVRLDLVISMPSTVKEEYRARLMRAADACPVKQSFREDTMIECRWIWA
jgi:putative redox protein